MDASTAAVALVELFPSVYSVFYRRRNPRDPHPSPESIAILEHLMAAGPLTVEEAARHFDRSQSAMSERLLRLVRQGLLERLVDERDRRRHLHWLSPAGEELWRRERAVLDQDRLRSVLGRVSPENRAALIEGIRGLLEAAALDAQQRGGNHG